LSVFGEAFVNCSVSEKSITQAELTERNGRHLKAINEIIEGKTTLTPETALQFEKVLNIKASFWNNRELHFKTFQQIVG